MVERGRGRGQGRRVLRIEEVQLIRSMIDEGLSNTEIAGYMYDHPVVR